MRIRIPFFMSFFCSSLSVHTTCSRYLKIKTLDGIRGGMDSFIPMGKKCLFRLMEWNGSSVKKFASDQLLIYVAFNDTD